jgi:hypothetical protein
VFEEAEGEEPAAKIVPVVLSDGILSPFAVVIVHGHTAFMYICTFDDIHCTRATFAVFTAVAVESHEYP